MTKIITIWRKDPFCFFCAKDKISNIHCFKDKKTIEVRRGEGALVVFKKMRGRKE